MYSLLKFFLAQRFLAMLGFQMRSVAVGWQVYEMTHRPLDLGFVGLAQFLPLLVFSLIAGQVVDRYDRKRVLLVSQAVDCSCSVLLFSLAVSGRATTGAIYCTLALLGALRPFAGAAGQSLLPSLVAPEHFTRAVAWSSSVWQLTVTLGPAVGGLVYALSSSATAVYATSAVAVALATIFTLFLRPRAETLERGPVTWESLLAGLKFIRSRKVMLGAISMDLFAVLLGGAVALLPAYARDILQVGPMGLGLLRSAPGLGASLMGLWLARRPLSTKTGLKMYSSVLTFGIATIIFGLSTNFALSLVCLLIMGAADLVSVVVRGALVQMMTPAQMRGRVSAVNLVFIGTSNELGEFESGLTAAWWGVVPSVIIGGVGTCLVVGFWIYLFPGLFKLHRVPSSSES